MKIAGGALCECQNCWSGMYCDIYTCPNDTNTDRELTAEEKAAAEYQQSLKTDSPGARTRGDARRLWWHAALGALLVTLASFRA